MSHEFIGTLLDRPDPWDVRMLSLASLVASWSKDPTTKTGAVITDDSYRIVSVGFNGLPRDVKDTPERLGNREVKYETIIHADTNAILFAQRDLTGCFLYTYPFPPCSRCAGLVIQSGIRTVVSPYPSTEILSRWKRSLELAAEMYHEAGVELYLVRMQ